MKVNKPHYKIAIITTTPHYYHVPLFRRLAKSNKINLAVYYCSDETLRGFRVEKMHKSKGHIVSPDSLLGGYSYKFLRNYSPFPSSLRWPFGLINLDIWREIKEGKYDAIVLQSWTNLTWWLAILACLKFNTPFFFMTDSNILSNILLERLRNPFKRNFRNIVLAELFKKTAVFLTAGKANEQFYKAYGAPEKKMVQLPFSWGYEEILKKAQKLVAEREDLRKSLDIKKNDFVLLYVGRLAEEKNLFVLLEAFNLVNHPRVKLFFVGGGPLRSKVEEGVKELKLKEVYLMGFQPRETVFNFYTIADAFVLPSGNETWGIVVNEAMCFGLPIIVSSQVGAAVDLVKDGYNGFIFPAGDSEKLAACIKKSINLSPEERLLFGKRSIEIIIKWIGKIDPVQQILKAIKIAKNANHD